MQTIPISFMQPDDGFGIAKSRPADELADIPLGWLAFGCELVAGDVNIGALAVIELVGPFSTTEKRPVPLRLEQPAIEVIVAMDRDGIRPLINIGRSQI